MNGQNRENIKIGILVDIVLKADQKSGKLTRGHVKHILSKSPTHILQLFLCRRLRRNYETQKEIVRLIVNGYIRMEYLPELVFKGP